MSRHHPLRIAAFLAVGLTVFMLAGCGQAGSPRPSPSSDNTVACRTFEAATVPLLNVFTDNVWSDWETELANIARIGESATGVVRSEINAFVVGAPSPTQIAGDASARDEVNLLIGAVTEACLAEGVAIQPNRFR